VVNLDDFAIGELIGALLLIEVGVFTSVVSLLVVHSDVAHLLFNLAYDVEVLLGKRCSPSH
jgi:hypothetical protein